MESKSLVFNKTTKGEKSEIVRGSSETRLPDQLCAPDTVPVTQTLFTASMYRIQLEDYNNNELNSYRMLPDLSWDRFLDIIQDYFEECSFDKGLIYRINGGPECSLWTKGDYVVYISKIQGLLARSVDVIVSISKAHGSSVCIIPRKVYCYITDQ